MNDPEEAWELLFKKALARDDLTAAIKILEQCNKSSGTPWGCDKVKVLKAVQLLADNMEKLSVGITIT